MKGKSLIEISIYRLNENSLIQMKNDLFAVLIITQKI